MTFTIDSMFGTLSIVEVTVSPVDTISMDGRIVGMRRIVRDARVFMWGRCCGNATTYWTFWHAVTEGDACTTPVCPVIMMFYDIVVTMTGVFGEAETFVVICLGDIVLTTIGCFRTE